jgi:parvulin-like peptidyl-prolyl isomerase
MDAVRRLLVVAGLAAVGCNAASSGVNNLGQYQPVGANVVAPQVARPQAPPADPPDPVLQAGGPAFAAANTQVRVVATIGTDTVITDDEVWQMVRVRAAEYLRLTGEERAAKEKAVFNESLLQIIERELIVADFINKVKKNKPQAVEEIKEEADRIATRQLKDLKKANNVRTEEEFQQMLKASGVNAKVLHRHYERTALSQMYVGQLMKEKTRAISLADVERYYADHPDEFTLEDRVKWLDLFISYRYFNTSVEARQFAEGLVSQARAGADFVGLVRQHGHGDSKLRDGAGIGEKHGEIKPPELEPALFALNAGEVSNPIPTENGFHILKVVERDVAGLRPFDQKTQAFIRLKLTALAQKAEYEKLIEELWRKTTVKVVTE